MASDKIGKNVVVTLEYKLSLDDGTTVEFSEESDPLVYLHGHEQIIPGLENALAGLKAGDKKSITVEPEEGYGEYDAEDFDEVPLADMPPGFEPEIGMLLEVHGEDDDDDLAVITEITADHLVLDYNHPMAGKRLHFEITVISLRDASKEEIEHGHAHDDHHHHN